MDWTVEYYQRENGDTPVLDFLLSLNPKMRAKVYSEIELLQQHGPKGSLTVPSVIWMIMK